MQLTSWNCSWGSLVSTQMSVLHLGFLLTFVLGFSTVKACISRAQGMYDIHLSCMGKATHSNTITTDQHLLINTTT